MGGVNCGFLSIVVEMKFLELTSRVAVDKSGFTEACLQLDFSLSMITEHSE